MTVEDIYNILFVTALIISIALFLLLRLLLNRLIFKHLKKYKSMGEPTLFINKIKGDWNIFKFILLREHKIIGDNYLSWLADTMLFFMITYFILFLSLVFIIVNAR